MSAFKYVKRGVKRKHSIIEGVLPILEQIAEIDGVRKVIPASISYSPNRRISGQKIRLQRGTVSGFKLLAHCKGAIQEIFVVTDGQKKKDVENKLVEFINSTNK